MIVDVEDVILRGGFDPQIVQQPQRRVQPVGRVVEVLGEIDDPGMEIEIAVRKYDVPHRFSAETLAQSAKLPEKLRAADLKQRIDLRDVPLVTIDGEDARDFDDAVYCEPFKQGRGKKAFEGWRLLVNDPSVSISVSHLTFINSLILVIGMLAPGYVSRVLGIRPDDAVYVMAPAGIGMLVGIGISLVQTVTQLHDQTLSLVPKIIAMVAATLFLVPWLAARLLEYVRPDAVHDVFDRHQAGLADFSHQLWALLTMESRLGKEAPPAKPKPPAGEQRIVRAFNAGIGRFQTFAAAAHRHAVVTVVHPHRLRQKFLAQHVAERVGGHDVADVHAPAVAVG